MSNIKAVILDWAGTTVDYGCVGPALVFVEVFKKWNLEISIEQARRPMGLAKKDHTRMLLNLPDVIEQWNAMYGTDPNERDLDGIFEELEPTMAHMIQNFATPIYGANRFVEELRKRNIKVGSTTGYVASMMEKLAPISAGLGFIPDCIVNSSEVPVGRPAPYMCYLNAQRMRVYPMNCMVKIGDTVADIEEGINAGMWTIGLTLSGNEVGMTSEEISETDPVLVSRLVDRAGRKLLGAGAHYIADGIWDCLPIIDEIDRLIHSGETPHSVSCNNQAFVY